MKASAPPVLATWLLTRLASGEKSESLIGDLIDQHGHGRSSAWYWRQTIGAIVTGFATQVWHQKALAIAVVALGTYLPDIFLWVVRPVSIARLDGWYPRLIDWLLKMEMDRVRPWILSRLRRRQRGSIATLLVATQVGVCVPYLRIAVTDWLGEPSNPIWFFNVILGGLWSPGMTPAGVRTLSARA